jgi:hypothetical protein
MKTSMRIAWVLGFCLVAFVVEASVFGPERERHHRGNDQGRHWLAHLIWIEQRH